jgi:hypothetical protein
MLQIQNLSQLDLITDPDILKLLKMRHDQLGDEMFGSVIIIETGDSLSEIEEEIGFSILTNLFDDVHFPNPDFVPCFEALEDHGTFYEMVFIFGDADDAIEIFIPKHGVSDELLAMCSQYAVSITEY